MVQTHKLNYVVSKKLYEKCSEAITVKECYNNVFNTIYYNGDKFSSGEWRVAYGYYPAIENLLARHCFIVNHENEAIDPTIFTQSDPASRRDNMYVSFKVFDGLGDYLEAIEKEDNMPALFHTFLKTERDIVQPWAKENGFILMG